MPAQTEFEVFLQEEVEKVKGRYYPVNSSLLRRMMVKKVNCHKLHPNPEDEFCIPKIGPNYEIISGYVQQYKILLTSGYGDMGLSDAIKEPLIVQRTMPDGYMILNGHHRWAAAMRSGVKKVQVSIVNLTQEKDIREMLKKSTSDKRVTLDLDEVVFCAKDDPNREKPLPFPLRLLFREDVREGIPALFHFLNKQGYDIWVFTSKYYSMDYIRSFFKVRQIKLTGIVTGFGRGALRRSRTGKQLKQLADTQYATTIDIDNEMILRTMSGSKECDDRHLSGNAASWSREVMDIIREMTEDA